MKKPDKPIKDLTPAEFEDFGWKTMRQLLDKEAPKRVVFWSFPRLAGIAVCCLVLGTASFLWLQQDKPQAQIAKLAPEAVPTTEIVPLESVVTENNDVASPQVQRDKKRSDSQVAKPTDRIVTAVSEVTVTPQKATATPTEHPNFEKKEKTAPSITAAKPESIYSIPSEASPKYNLLSTIPAPKSAKMSAVTAAPAEISPATVKRLGVAPTEEAASKIAVLDYQSHIASSGNSYHENNTEVISLSSKKQNALPATPQAISAQDLERPISQTPIPTNDSNMGMETPSLLSTDSLQDTFVWEGDSNSAVADEMSDKTESSHPDDDVTVPRLNEVQTLSEVTISIFRPLRNTLYGRVNTRAFSQFGGFEVGYSRSTKIYKRASLRYGLEFSQLRIGKSTTGKSDFLKIPDYKFISVENSNPVGVLVQLPNGEFDTYVLDKNGLPIYNQTGQYFVHQQQFISVPLQLSYRAGPFSLGAGSALMLPLWPSAGRFTTYATSKSYTQQISIRAEVEFGYTYNRKYQITLGAQQGLNRISDAPIYAPHQSLFLGLGYLF